MISYDELVYALTTWRAEQGLPPMQGNTPPSAALGVADIPASYDQDFVADSDVHEESEIVEAGYVGNTDDIATPNDDMVDAALASEDVLTPDMDHAPFQSEEPFESDHEPFASTSDDSYNAEDGDASEVEAPVQEEDHPMFTEDEGATKIVEDPQGFDSETVAADDDDDDYYDAIASEEVEPPPVVETEDNSAESIEAAADEVPFSPFDSPTVDGSSIDVMTSAQDHSEPFPPENDYSDDDGESTRVGGIAGYDIEDELE